MRKIATPKLPKFDAENERVETAVDHPVAADIAHDGELVRLVWKYFEEDIFQTLAEVQEASTHQNKITSRRLIYRNHSRK
jgi:hypothetical protein